MKFILILLMFVLSSCTLKTSDELKKERERKSLNKNSLVTENSLFSSFEDIERVSVFEDAQRGVVCYVLRDKTDSLSCVKVK